MINKSNDNVIIITFNEFFQKVFPGYQDFLYFYSQTPFTCIIFFKFIAEHTYSTFFTKKFQYEINY